MSYRDYHILETELGPMISHSRVSVYDVMLAQNEADDLLTICTVYNLCPLQVQIALDYIAQNRNQLEADLAEILPQKAEEERYYRALAAEIQEQIKQLPMTPERAAFNALRQHHRQRRGELETANYLK